MKIDWLHYFLIEAYCLGYDWREGTKGLDNGLASNKRQAIVWTNDDPLHRCIYAALGEISYLRPARISPQSIISFHFL